MSSLPPPGQATRAVATPAHRRAARFAEAREILRLAWPIIVAQLAGVGMGAVDTVFAGQLGPTALAAVAMGVNLNTVFFVPVMGCLMALSALVAHRRGAGAATADIAAFLRRSRRFALVVATLWFVLLNLCAATALRGLGLSPETTDGAIRFVRWLSPSAYGFTLFFTLRFGAEGLGQTRPILVAGLIGLALNTVLDWLLVFGRLGAPALGTLGCGVATSVSTLAMAAVMWAWYHRADTLRPYLQRGGHAAAGIAEILRLGLPIGAIMLAEAGLFVLVAMLMARFGDATVAAYQIAINFSALLFMIPVGMAQATTVRVGLAAGASDFAQARHRGYIGMSLGLANAASNAAVMVFAGTWVVGFYTQDAAIGRQAAHFLVLAACFQFFDGLQCTANGALRGLKDTRLPMIVTLLAYWAVGLPVAGWLAWRTSAGADGLWWGLTAGLGVAAAGLSLRFALLASRTR